MMRGRSAAVCALFASVIGVSAEAGTPLENSRHYFPLELNRFWKYEVMPGKNGAPEFLELLIGEHAKGDEGAGDADDIAYIIWESPVEIKVDDRANEYVVASLDRRLGLYWPEAHSYLLQGQLKPNSTWHSKAKGETAIDTVVKMESHCSVDGKNYDDCVTVAEKLNFFDDPVRCIEWTFAAQTGVVYARYIDGVGHVVKTLTLKETGILARKKPGD